MSPTEDDLRTALRDGAGETPDADHIMAAADHYRTQRQKRLLSAAAAVIVVGGVATGATLLSHNNGNDETASGGAGIGTSAAPHARAAGTDSLSGSTCPADVSTSGALAGTTASGTDTNGRLFAKPVASALVCAYPATTPSASNTAQAPDTIRLTGTEATTLTNSLENATKVRPATACPDIRRADQRTIVVLARTADGTQLPAVTTTINEVACAVVVSNGSAQRYAWTPPAPLHEDFARLTTRGATNNVQRTVPAGGAGTMSGSPLH